MDQGEGSIVSASPSTSLSPPELLYELGPHLELGTSFSPAGLGRQASSCSPESNLTQPPVAYMGPGPWR